MLVEVVTLKEFLERHGRPLKIGDGTELFADGAERRKPVFEGAAPEMVEPPRAAKPRLQTQIRYLEILIVRVRKHFDEAKPAFVSGATILPWDPAFGPRPPGDVYAQLISLKEVHDQARRRLKELEANLADLPEVRAAREAAERNRRLDADDRRRQAEEEQRRRELAAAVNLDENDAPELEDKEGELAALKAELAAREQMTTV